MYEFIMNRDNGKVYITIEQLADFCDISHRKIRQWIESKGFFIDKIVDPTGYDYIEVVDENVIRLSLAHFSPGLLVDTFKQYVGEHDNINDL